MKFLLVTGVSGGGKSQTVKFLEDLGYFCMDNIPPVMIPKIRELFDVSETSIGKVAFVIDICNRDFFDNFESVIKQMKDDVSINFSVLFLECSDSVILNRYKENKRLHPLASGFIDNKSAIELERKWIDPIKAISDYIIDTTSFSIWDLKKEIYAIFGSDRKEKGIKAEIMSFGFKHGIPATCDYVFDVRFIPNPYYVQELRKMTGMDDPVREFVMKRDETKAFMKKLCDMIKFLMPMHENEGKDFLVIGIGCTGGRHRSVSIAEELGSYISKSGYKANVIHRDMKNDVNHMN